MTIADENVLDWIEMCRHNDRAAQEKLYKHFFNDMFALCRRYARDQHEALTILNDGFLKVFSNIANYNSCLGNFRPWLKTIIINTAIDFTRRNKKETYIIHIDQVQEQGDDDFRLAYKNNLEEILQHFNLLPSVTRIVVNLFAFDGYTHKDISQQLNISETTSRWHLAEARKRLKGSMQFKQTKQV
ncbi:MAG TPA: sigma-70 family RNA polymerase sigma factor [Ferruginibacter sp.]|nr:sigma-70 family RNA polymerase sigma factor [Ferruginibacter sp.]HPH93199.1 sigma-70 family RNA polymerase sigma factor [Ferruginibacter sp.]